MWSLLNEQFSEASCFEKSGRDYVVADSNLTYIKLRWSQRLQLMELDVSKLAKFCANLSSQILIENDFWVVASYANFG